MFTILKTQTFYPFKLHIETGLKNSQLSIVNSKIVAIAFFIFMGFIAFTFQLMHLSKRNKQATSIPKNPHLSPPAKSSPSQKNNVSGKDNFHQNNEFPSLNLFNKMEKDDFYGISKDKALINVENSIAEFDKKYTDGISIRELLKDNALKDALVKYPQLFKFHIENFNRDKKYYSSIQFEIIKFCNFLDFFSTEDDIIVEGCLQISELMDKLFFSSNELLVIAETNKEFAILFFQFFSILDRNINTIKIKQPELAKKLKIQFANLPIIDSRSCYPNLYLTENEQLHILVEHFQKIENENIDEAIKAINAEKLSKSDINKIALMADDNKKYLNSNNLGKLRNAIGKVKFSWNKSNIADHINSKYSFNSKHYNYYNYNSGDNRKIIKLYRASKAKKYFEDQLGFHENNIKIPRWYHATKPDNFKEMLKKNPNLEVRHLGRYLGAWISNQREHDYGIYTLAFTHNITFINAEVEIQTQQGQVRWRGLQARIPFVNPDKPHLIFVGLEKKDKSEKGNIKLSLKNLTIHPVVMSNDQLNFMQKGIFESIGCPNLSEEWWGKADVKTIKPIR